MLGDTAQLMVRLSLQDQMSSGLSRATSSVSGFASRAGGLSGIVGGVGTAMGHAKNQIMGVASSVGLLAGGAGIIGLVGALKSATDSATNFQAAMEMIRTQAGASQAEVDSMSAALQKLSTSVGTGPETLAAGLYHVESAGIRGAQALDVLTAAAQGAKVGNADLESVTNALIASVTSGVGGVSSMTEAMGTLNAVVGSGNMRMQDLTDAFGTGILSTAKTFGLSIQSVGAAIADMTNQGVPAIDAATRLRMTISLMGAPTTKAAKELKSIGIGQLDLANAMRGPNGIVGAIDLLQRSMVKAHLIDSSGNVTSAGANLLSQAFGGGRSSSAIMTLLGSYQKLGQIQTQVTQGAGSFGDAWAATEQTAAEKFANFQAGLQSLAITAGNVLLPVFSDMAQGAAKFLTDNQTGIISGLRQVVSLAKDVGAGFRAAFGVLSAAWGAIPGPLQQLLVGGFIAQKASSWLFGSGPLQWGKNLLGGVLGRVPGVGAVAGAVGLGNGTPVYVTNWPLSLGGITSAGASDIAPGLGAAAGGIGAGTLAAGAAITGVAAAAVGATYLLVRDQLQKQGSGMLASAQGMTASGATTADLQRALAGAQAGQEKLNSNLFTQFGGLIFGSNTQLDQTIASLKTQIAASQTRDKQARDYSGVAHMLQDAVKSSSKLNSDALLPSLQNLVGLYTSSLSPNTMSMANSMRTMEALQQRFASQGDTQAVAAIQQMQDTLAAQMDQLGVDINGLGPIMSAAAASAYQGSAAYQGYRAGERGGGSSVTVNVHSSTSARQNNHAAVIQYRYGPTGNAG